MSRADQHIDQLFRDKLKKGKSSKPGNAEWSSIRGKIGLKNFFGFNPFQFNIFYLAAGIVGAGALGYHLYNTGHIKKEEPVEEYCIEKDTVKKQQENSHHLFREEIERIEQKHHKSTECAPSHKKSDQNSNQAENKKESLDHATTATSEKSDKINIANSDSSDKKSYFCKQKEDSIRRVEQRMFDSMIYKINTKELKFVEKPRGTVLKFRQDTIIQRDTNKIRRDKYKFKWKKR